MTTTGNTGPTSLEKLQGAVATDIAIETQAVTLILEIPGLIKAAQGSDNPDAALDALTASLSTAGSNLQGALGGSASTLAFGAPVLPDATVGVAYTGSIPTTGGVGPVSVSTTGLPARLSADSSGNVTGTPTAAPGSYTGTASAADSGNPAQTATLTGGFTLNVVAAPTS